MATRRERVVLDLTDNLSAGLGRAAAQAALLRRELDGLNGGTRDASRGNDDLTRSSSRLTNQLGNQDRTLQNSTRQIDRYSGRLKLIGQAISLLGPAAIPIGALAVPAVAGLATQLGFAAAAGGTAILAFQGVGDALKAMNTAHLEPTAANLQAAQVAMENLGPAAQHLVTQLHNLGDEGKALRDAAAEGFLPGVSKSLDELQSRLPQVERILTEIGDAAGDALAGGASSLASGRWDDFFNFLETDARSTLSDLAASIGNVTHGLAELLMATDPLADGFSGWLVTATERFDKWAQGLDQTEGFQDFIDYVRTNGPQVAETVGAIGSALVDIVQAAAPLGGVVLQGIEAVAKVLSAIADSNLGTPIMAGLAAMSLMTRATALWGSTAVTSGRASVASTLTAASGYNSVALGAQRATMSVAEFAAAQRAAAAATAAARGKMAMMAGGIALMAASQTEAAKSAGLSNAAMFAGLGLMGGPWTAAIGGAVGLTMDFAQANDGAEAAVERLNDAMAASDWGAARVEIESLGTEIEDLEKKSGWLGAAVKAIPVIGAWAGPEATTHFDDEIQAYKDLREARIAAMPGIPSITGAGGAAIAADLQKATAAAEELHAALTLVYGLLDQRSDIRAAKASLDDFTAGLKENGRTFNDNTAAGRANLDLLDNIAETHNRVAEDMKASNRIPYLRTARADFVDAAKKLGMTGKQARDLATDLGLLNTLKVSPKVDVDTKGAEAGVRRLGKVFNGLPDRVQTNIAANGIPKTMGEVNRLVKKYGLTEKERRALITLKDAASPLIKAIMKLLDTTDRKHPKPTVSVNDQATGVINRIKGMVIPDKSFTITTNYAQGVKNRPENRATGGLLVGPGTGTSDSIPLLGSNGEYMVKTAAVQKYGVGFLDQVNAMRYAAGGQVGMAASAAGSGSGGQAWPMEMVVRGTLKTPWGPAEVEGIATKVHRREYDADREFERSRA